MCWESFWREHPEVELSLDEGIKNIVVFLYQLCGEKIGDDRCIESDGLSGMAHPIDETVVEIASPLMLTIFTGGY